MDRRAPLRILLTLSLLSFSIVAFAQNEHAHASGPYAGPHGADVFVMLVKTDNLGVSNDNQFTIPTSGGGYDYHVDCDNDGNFDHTNATGNVTCTYDQPGTYSVVISGTFPRIYSGAELGSPFKEFRKLIEIQQWGTNQWTSMHAAFAHASNLQLTAQDTPDLSNVTNTSYMFHGANSINADLSAWQVDNVETMAYMFSSAASFNGDVSTWNVSKVTNMHRMFSGASAFNSDLSEWNVGNVNDMSSMFQSASSFNSDISNWDVSNVENMSQMFTLATSFNGDLSSWNVSKVANMYGMFIGAEVFNSDLSSWNVSNVTDMTALFSGASSFNQNISSWDVAKVTSFDATFHQAVAFNQDLSGWDTSSAETFYGMFNGASSFTSDLSSWNTSQVTTMQSMFSNARAFNSDISQWDVSNVVTLHSMFSGAISFNSDLSGWDVSSVTNMDSTFYRASSFTSDISGWDVSKVTSMFLMFSNNGMSSENYDELLDKWSELQLQEGVIFDAGLSRYCENGHLRDLIVSQFNWTIRDGGQSCISVPVVSNGTSHPGNNYSSILWDILDAGNSSVISAGIEYGPTEVYGNTVMSNDPTALYQSVQLEPLECGTTYHFRTFASNSLGVGYGEDQTFVTSPCPAPPVVITGDYLYPSQDTVVLLWEITDQGDSGISTTWIEYGLTIEYGSLQYGSYYDVGQHSASISGLSCGTIYHYRAYAQNHGGREAYGEDRTFETAPCPVAPTVITGEATSIGPKRAEIPVEVTDAGDNFLREVGVEYGLTEDFGNSNWSGDSLGLTYVDLTYLECDTTYYYRGYALNNSLRGYGETKTFTTAPCPGPADLSVEVEMLTSSEIKAGSTIRYEITGTNHGPDSSEVINSNGGILIYIVAPGTSTFVDAQISDPERFFAECQDWGKASDVVESLSTYPGRFIACSVVSSTHNIEADESFTFTIDFLTDHDFTNGVETLGAMLIPSEYDPDFTDLMTAIQGPDPILDFEINNIATSTYNYSSTPTTTIPPTTTAPPTTTTTPTTSAPTTTPPTTTMVPTSPTTSTPRDVPVTTYPAPVTTVFSPSQTTTTQPPTSDPAPTTTEGPTTVVDNKVTETQPSGQAAANPEAEEQDDPTNTLILGNFSATGSNALDLLLIAFILGAIGFTIHKFTKRKRTMAFFSYGNDSEDES